MTELQQEFKLTELEENDQHTESEDSYSFIVRVWKESSAAADENPAGWRGSIERVGLHQRMYIHQLESILAFIEEQTGMRAQRLHPIQAIWRWLRRGLNAIRYGNG
jgi:hypothetical protein